ncbi:hypothetical protein [Pseudoduganella buxea]|uniref:PEP-CTERM sorting domain-containing protein n=1 Tax=Pseudoduganella buxea TaxID=1949069 RepID=A0A6I3SVZ1_9BURK|nr:hypothetical protein [Pseudoduganella buxea]MTV52855.1 hypothetical protein [Pseudoduganella buxea]GGC02480.1 hypothetical protein GCM10011572_25510 [Pseudoduganella buxea]
MKHILRAAALVGALLASGAQAVPFHYNFYGTVQQATFDPASPFRVTPGPGTALIGRVFFDTEAPDLAPDDPSVGVYGRTDGAPFFLQLELYPDSTPLVFVFNDYRIGVVDGPVRDQYTLHGEAGNPDGLNSYAMFDMQLDYPGSLFRSDALPAIPPDLFYRYPHTFMLTGAVNRGGQLYQYEVAGIVYQVPAPATDCLLLAGCGAGVAVWSRRRRAS